MIPAPRVVMGPSLYRHECWTCREETLHNARGCVRCETKPWTTKVTLTTHMRKMQTGRMRRLGRK